MPAAEIPRPVPAPVASADVSFPTDFVWGAATSAYQIEGATQDGGRGTCIWDTFTRTPGKIEDGTSGAVACDFYHRYPQDVALMRELGLDAFRFSVAWPRVIPDGRGPINHAGLDFYDRLVDELLEAGIAPLPTLFHWDLPQPLEDAGGWPERSTAEAFAEYTEAVAARLGDRVDQWTTHNEPFCASWLGYVVGMHAPGRTDVAAGIAAAHHLLLSHGLAVDVLRRTCPRAEVGIILDSWPAHPASDDPRDLAAAWITDGVRNRLFFDPLFRARYPQDVLGRLAPHAPPVRDGDLETIAAPLDFVGMNNYSRTVVRADDAGNPVEVPPSGVPTTAMGWEIYPQAIYEVLTRMHRDYGIDRLYVTENGAAFDDVLREDGTVDDPDRIAYLDAHLRAVAAAIAEGVPVEGYFVWSLLDNFEWSLGYSKRFGIVYVDYETLDRVPKASFSWYRDLIASGRLP